MLGGTLVNMTGPCFKPDTRVMCRFNNMDSEGTVYTENRAACVMPWTRAEGWVDFEIALDGGPYYWKGQFFVGNTITCRNVQFTQCKIHTKVCERIP